MNRFILTSIVCILSAICIYSQKYTRTDDYFGYPVNSEMLLKIESASAGIDSLVLPEITKFQVVDFRFYKHNDLMEGTNSISNIWDDLIQDTENQFDFFLLYAFNIANTGKIETKLKIKIPDVSIFSCIDEDKITLIEGSLLAVFSDLELEGVDEQLLESLIIARQLFQKEIDCCGGNYRYSEDFSPINLALEVYYVDNKKWVKAIENEALYFFGNVPPKIYAKLLYSKPINFCTDLILKEKIQYKAKYGDKSACFDTIYTNEYDAGIGLVYNLPYVPPPNISLKLFENIKFGGRAKIEIIVNDEVVKDFSFTIKGKNPKIGEILKYIDILSSDTTLKMNFWMLKYIMMHESGLSKAGFTSASDEAHHFRKFATIKNVTHYLEDDYHINWSDSYELPTLSFDCGYGIMQLTNPPPHTGQIWNWKKNVLTAAYRIKEKKKTVSDNLTAELNIVKVWNNAHEDNQVSKSPINYAGHEWVFAIGKNFLSYNSGLTNYFNKKIEKGQHSILDAGLILYYNGNGNHHFLQADVPSGGGKPVWRIVDTGYEDTDYIHETMKTIVPSY